MNKTELNFSSQWDVYSARTDWAPTVLKLIHTATPDKTKLSCLCRFRFGAVNWIVKTVADWKFEVRTRSQQSSNLHRDTRDDKTVAPACRPPPRRRRPGRQLRLAARPPTRSDVVRHVKRKHAVDCCIWQTKRHATRVICWLFQTVSRLNSHRLTRHRQHCLVVSGDGRCELGISFAAANQVVTLTRVTNERVVQLGRLAAGQLQSRSCAMNEP